MRFILSETLKNILFVINADICSDIVLKQILSNNIKKTETQNELIYQCVTKMFKLSLKFMQL